LNPDLDLSTMRGGLVGETDGVREKVDDDLAETDWVGHSDDGSSVRDAEWRDEVKGDSDA
jgi:hypothetical protein